MTTTSDRLYNLLPVIYRLRRSEQGEPLRALLSIISDELATVKSDITSLYENWFIETSDEWVVPYIGDLLAVRGLNMIKATALSQRAYVANTLFYRRRKGTAYVLELLAKDVTGWPAQVVEFFELLQTTQYTLTIAACSISCLICATSTGWICWIHLLIACRTLWMYVTSITAAANITSPTLDYSCGDCKIIHF